MLIFILGIPINSDESLFYYLIFIFNDEIFMVGRLGLEHSFNIFLSRALKERIIHRSKKNVERGDLTSLK